MRNRALPGILAFIALSAVVAFLGVFSPLSAQDVPLATNTPRVLATNTPRPPVPIPVTPDAPLENYALRLWSEFGLVELLSQQSRALRQGDLEGELAIQLLQFELARRFPGAPRNADDRAQLLNAMLAAPRGSIDMRDVARLHLEDVFTALSPSLEFAGSYERDGWLFEVIPANADNRPPRDAVVHSLFPASPASADAVLYEDYVFISNPVSGIYRVYDADFPAAPLGDAVSLSSPLIGDITADGADEIVFLINTSDLNQRLYIFGWRGDSIANLVLPGAPAFASNIQDLQPGSQAFTGQLLRLESPRWQCLGEQTVPWRFTLNYYRPAADPGGFTDQRTLACALYRAEPFFEMAPDEAISTIENLLSALSDDPAAPRAQLALAVLYALDDQPDVASGLANAISSPEVSGQAQALIDAIAADSTPAQICAAVVRAADSSDEAFCDVDQLLTRLFAEEPLLRDESIAEQLSAMGIHVRDQVTIQQVGRFDRQAVSFDLAGTRWWAFAPLNAETYTAEQIAPPAGYEETPRGARVLKLPDAAIDALFRSDLSGALLALDNALRDQPGVVTAPDFAFMQALLHDITGQRTLARSEYYALWRDFPASLWGKLAASHLERR